MELFENLKKLAEFPKSEHIYKTVEVVRIKSSMESLVKQLKGKIDSGEYDALISDDASGRIPTLILRKILSERIKQTHPDFDDLLPEKKRELLKTYFVVGGKRTDNEKALSDFFKKIKPEVKKKVLLVTEYMETGKSMGKLALLLESAGIPFDIISAASSENKRHYVDRGAAQYKNHGLFIGKEDSIDPYLHNQPYISGVEKKILAHATAHPYRYETAPIEAEEKDLLPQSREDVNTMADEILKKVWGNK